VAIEFKMTSGQMPTKKARFLEVAIVLLTFATSAPAQTKQAPGSGGCVTHVLFLGNSYTYFNNLPAIFSELASAGHQCKVDARMVAPGGVRLKDLWEKTEAREVLSSQKWDYVVLQDQSTLGINYFLEGQPRVTSDAVFLPYAEKWVAEIVQHGARPVFYLTWARKTTPDDQAALNYAYIHAAKETGGIVAPVGIAWQEIRQHSPAIDLYYKDGSHPSRAGSYLAACVIYAAVFDQEPTDLPPRVSGAPVNLDTEKLEPEKTVVLVDLPRSEAEILQSAAWQAWQSWQAVGVHPTVAPVPAFSAGDALSYGNLAGTWSGELLFYPGVGPVEMVLELQSSGDDWKGHLNINYPTKDFAAESFDLSDLRVGEREFTFRDPKSAGVDNGSIEFRGALTGVELKGAAETKLQRKDSPPIVVLGDWTLRKRNP
jgi:hypothetical protein